MDSRALALHPPPELLRRLRACGGASSSSPAGTRPALITVVGPALMSYLLIGVTGKELTEKSMSSRPGYPEYVERTSGFFPLPPGSAAARAT